MKQLTLINAKNEELGKIKLPEQFNENYRPDLIKRSFDSMRSHNRQPYGSDPLAGKKSSAKLSKRRRKYRGSYGKGISRVPRKILSRRGSQMNWVAAFAPGTVGGRRAHPPKTEKIFWQKINKKERKKALRSSLSAVMIKDIVKSRGHLVPENYPFAVSSEIENIEKTKVFADLLVKLGFEKELERAHIKKIRAGKGKSRGRKYKKRKGPLVIVSENCKLMHAARNIPGVDIVKAENINVALLAPGSHPGRCTIITDKAIKKIESERLFL